MYLNNLFLYMILFNLRLYNYLFVVCIMNLSVRQKEQSITVKFAVRTSGSKIEVITAGVHILELYCCTRVPLMGTRLTSKCMLRDTAWKQCAACAG